jgi:surface antigen
MRFAAGFVLTCMLLAAAPSATFAQAPCRHLEGEERERCRAEQRAQQQQQQTEPPPQQRQRYEAPQQPSYEQQQQQEQLRLQRQQQREAVRRQQEQQQQQQQQQQQTTQPSAESYQEQRRRERQQAREQYRQEQQRAVEEQQQQQQRQIQQRTHQGWTVIPSVSQQTSTAQPNSSTPTGPTGGYPYWDRQPDLQGGCDEAVDEWGFCYRECTSYVAWKLNASANGTFFTNRMGGGRWGNASNWASNARDLGYTVNSSPSVGSIAWFSYGHVAYVERVNSNGTVEVSEYNYHTRTAPHTYGRRTLNASDVSAFIYVSQSTPPSVPQQTTNPYPLPTFPNNTANTTPQTTRPTQAPSTSTVQVLSVSGISSRYSPSRAPHTEAISLRGEALNTVREIRWSWSGPNDGSTTWRRGDSNWSSRFSASSDGRSATVRPVLLAANDPAGRYEWTVTFYGEGSPVSRSFRVEFGETVSATELEVGSIRDISSSSAPYQRSINLSGEALNTLTEIRWSWRGPNSGSSTWRRGDSSWSSRFSASSNGRSATVRPTLIAANDPPGRYEWTVTFVASGQSVTKRFRVEYDR